jgi:hypothetical protein
LSSVIELGRLVVRLREQPAALRSEAEEKERLIRAPDGERAAQTAAPAERAAALEEVTTELGRVGGGGS